MANEEGQATERNSAYIGEGVIFKGSISVPDNLVVDGTIEGDVTARSLVVGVTGAIKGNVASSNADIHGKLSENVEVKDFLYLRSTGQIGGKVTCGDVQIERGAMLSASITSMQSAQEQPAVVERPAAVETRMRVAMGATRTHIPLPGAARMRIAAAE